MKVDSFKNNRKALFALLLCSGFIATHPLAVMAESENYSVQNVQQKQTVSGIVKDSSGEPIIGGKFPILGYPLLDGRQQAPV